MSEGGFGFPFGGDPEDLLRGLREFAEQQAESALSLEQLQAVSCVTTSIFVSVILISLNRH